MVADFRLLAPDGLPRLVERVAAGVGDLEIVVQRNRRMGVVLADAVSIDLDFGDVQIAAQFETQLAGQDDRTAVVVERVAGLAGFGERDAEAQLAVGRAELLRCGGRRSGEQQSGECREYAFEQHHR